MKKFLSILLALATTLSILTVSVYPADEEFPFTDVPEDEWYYDAVKTAYDTVIGGHRIVDGKTETTFEPKSNMKRSELAAVLTRLAGADEQSKNMASKGAETFPDVAADSWYAGYVGWAAENGIVKGNDDGTFKPENLISREEIAIMMVRFIDYLKLNIVDENPVEKFADEDKVSSWAAAEVEAIKATGLFKGDDSGCFNPQDFASRAEIATVASRLITVITAEPEGPDNPGGPDDPENPGTTDDSSIAANGTEYTYSFKWRFATERGLADSIADAADTSGKYTAKVTNYDEVKAEADKLAENGSATVNAAVEFTNGSSTISRTYSIKLEKGSLEVDETTTPDGLGVLKENGDVKISNTVPLKIDGNYVPASGVGTHGGHESKVLRTAHGTYIVYVTGDYNEYGYVFKGEFKKEELVSLIKDKGGYSSSSVEIKDDSELTKAASELESGKETTVDVTLLIGDNKTEVKAKIHLYKDMDLGTFSSYQMQIDTFSILKVTKNGAESLGDYEYPHSNGSCAPNIFAGEDGIVYVSIISVDQEKYYEKSTQQGAYLQIYELNESNNEIKVYTGRPDFYILHGYGYSQPIPDIKNGKIYALYTGGDVPGGLAWFTFDIKAKTWNTEPCTVETKYRDCYFNAYADGRGGFFFIGQRDVVQNSLIDEEGLDGYLKSNNGYIQDALYLFRVPDATKGECEIVSTIYEPDYKAIYEAMKVKPTGGVNAVTCTSYDTGFGYLDSDQMYHVIYYRVEDKTRWHIVYDTWTWEKVYEEQLNFTNANGTYSVAMAEGAGGDLYVIAYDKTAKSATCANLEVWKLDDDYKATCVMENVEMKTASGDKLNENDLNSKIIVSSTRNGSIMDGTVGLIFFNKIDGSKSGYNFVSIELK